MRKRPHTTAMVALILILLALTGCRVQQSVEDVKADADFAKQCRESGGTVEEYYPTLVSVNKDMRCSFEEDK